MYCPCASAVARRAWVSSLPAVSVSTAAAPVSLPSGSVLVGYATSVPAEYAPTVSVPAVHGPTVSAMPVPDELVAEILPAPIERPYPATRL